VDSNKLVCGVVMEDEGNELPKEFDNPFKYKYECLVTAMTPVKTTDVLVRSPSDD
jgi:hypothetical protein